MKQNNHLYEKNLISTLYAIKRLQGKITEEDILNVSKQLGIPTSKVYKVASFYEFPDYKEVNYNLLNKGPLTSKKSDTLRHYKHGYESFKKAVSKGQDFVLEEMEKSQLRGRGGAGFSAARKWKSCKKVSATEKYLLANGHNGDPGSISDRYLMAYHCHQLIEGMLIAGYTIGASKGIIYVEGEFKDSIKNLEKAIEQAYKNNILGKNVLGSGFDFDLKIFEAAGVYVCGESTALMKAIEGKAGEPKLKHIHTAEKGLFDKPTVLNNVETLINVPYIISISGEKYAETGTATSKGTKVFSLIGDVKKEGIVEVPMGIKLKEVINTYGKIDLEKDLKGVQFGGPLGGFIHKNSVLGLPPSQVRDLILDEYGPNHPMLGTSLCFDSLSKSGSMMGDALMVIGKNRSVFDVTRFFTKFLEDQSCGKCVSCKEGLRRINDLLNSFEAGCAEAGDLDIILELAENAKESSLCQLGKSIYNPVHTGIKLFTEDFKKKCQN